MHFETPFWVLRTTYGVHHDTEGAIFSRSCARLTTAKKRKLQTFLPSENSLGTFYGPSGKAQGLNQAHRELTVVISLFWYRNKYSKSGS